MNKYKQRKETADFPPVRMLIQGVSASGKTYLLKKILHEQLRGKFDEIYVICPTHKSQELWKSIKIKESNKYDKADNETFNAIIRKCEANREDDKESLIILDDWLYSDLSKANSALSNNILHLRHKWTSIILLSQYYKAIRPEVRTNMNKVIAFKNDSESEIHKMQEDYGDSWRSAYEDYTAEKYGYVFSDFEKSIYDNRFSNCVSL